MMLSCWPVGECPRPPVRCHALRRSAGNDILRRAPLAPAAAYDAVRLCWFDASRRKEAIQIGDVEPEQVAELVECDATLRDEPTHEPLADVQVLSRFQKG